MTSDFVIIPAELSHLDAMAEAERICFSGSEWTREMLEDALRDPVTRVYAAVAGGTLIGYCHASAVLDEGEILNVAVLPSSRRLGVGSALLRRALDELCADGVKSVYLEVRRSNEGARAMYGSFGFREIGVRRRYYRAPVEDAVIMRIGLGAEE